MNPQYVQYAGLAMLAYLALKWWVSRQEEQEPFALPGVVPKPKNATPSCQESLEALAVVRDRYVALGATAPEVEALLGIATKLMSKEPSREAKN